MKKRTRKLIVATVAGTAIVGTAAAIGYAVGAKYAVADCNRMMHTPDFIGDMTKNILDNAMTKIHVNDPQIGPLDLYAFNSAVEQAGGTDLVVAALAGLTSPVE